MSDEDRDLDGWREWSNSHPFTFNVPVGDITEILSKFIPFVEQERAKSYAAATRRQREKDAKVADDIGNGDSKAAAIQSKGGQPEEASVLRVRSRAAHQIAAAIRGDDDSDDASR